MSVPRKKSKALQVLAKNLATLMKDKNSLYRNDRALEARVRAMGWDEKFSYKTVERTRLLRTEPSLDNIEHMARVFGLEAWQILIPDLQVGERPEIRRQVAVEV